MADDLFIPCVSSQLGAYTDAVASIACERWPALFGASLLREDCPPLVQAHLIALRAYISGRTLGSLLLGTPIVGAVDGVELVQVGGEQPKLLIRNENALRIIDGQHRLAAIIGNARARRASPTRAPMVAELAGASVPVLFLLGRRDYALDQAVADAHRGHTAASGLIAPFDRADPLNGAVLEVIDSSPLRGLVDRRSPTLQRQGRAMFVFSSVRSFVTELVGGDEQHARTRLADAGERSRIVALAAELLTTLGRSMEPWREITEGREPISGQRMSELRGEYFNLTGAGLVAIGRVAGRLSQGTTARRRLQLWARIAAMDWRRASPQWSRLGPSLSVTDAGLEDAARVILDIV